MIVTYGGGGSGLANTDGVHGERNLEMGSVEGDGISVTCGIDNQLLELITCYDAGSGNLTEFVFEVDVFRQEFLILLDMRTAN